MKQENKGDFDAFDALKFDQQFVKFFQILDTDYKNFIVTYICMESADFFENGENGEPVSLTDEQAWAKKTKFSYTGNNEDTYATI